MQSAIDWTTVIISAAISTPAVSALVGFLGRLYSDKEITKLRAALEKELAQAKSDFEEEARIHQASIDKSILVTRAQLETEFQAMKELFEKLAEVRLLMAGLRPFFNIAPHGETDDDKKRRFTQSYEPFVAAYNRMIATIENLRPFYPEAVYQAAEQCRQWANREIIDIQTAGDSFYTHEWFKEGERNMTNFMEGYVAVSSLIRNRIAQLSVIRA